MTITTTTRAWHNTQVRIARNSEEHTTLRRNGFNLLPPRRESTTGRSRQSANRVFKAWQRDVQKAFHNIDGLKSQWPRGATLGVANLRSWLASL